MRKMLERRGGDEGNENYLIPERANIHNMKRSLDAALVFFFVWKARFPIGLCFDTIHPSSTDFPPLATKDRRHTQTP